MLNPFRHRELILVANSHQFLFAFSTWSWETFWVWSVINPLPWMIHCFSWFPRESLLPYRKEETKGGRNQICNLYTQVSFFIPLQKMAAQKPERSWNDQASFTQLAPRFPAMYLLSALYSQTTESDGSTAKNHRSSKGRFLGSRIPGSRTFAVVIDSWRGKSRIRPHRMKSTDGIRKVRKRKDHPLVQPVTCWIPSYSVPTITVNYAMVTRAI